MNYNQKGVKMKRSNIKCTMCSSRELVEARFPVEVFFDSGVSQPVVSYICSNCGHYEFFNFKFVESYTEKKKYSDEINNCLLQANSLEEQYNKATYKLMARKNEINEKLKDLDITVRTKMKLEDELKNIDDNIKIYAEKYLTPAEALKSKVENDLKTKQHEGPHSSNRCLVGEICKHLPTTSQRLIYNIVYLN